MMASKFGSMGKDAVIYNSVVDSFVSGMASRGETKRGEQVGPAPCRPGISIDLNRAELDDRCACCKGRMS